jgi:hypothetical protein
VPEVRDWLHELRVSDKETLALISQAITALRMGGPALGRPLVDSIRESRLANLKELRPGSRGRSEVRILFVFDPARNVVLLVAGDKGGHWNRWYRVAIPLAEERYAAYSRCLGHG